MDAIASAGRSLGGGAGERFSADWPTEARSVSRCPADASVGGVGRCPPTAAARGRRRSAAPRPCPRCWAGGDALSLLLRIRSRGACRRMSSASGRRRAPIRLRPESKTKFGLGADDRETRSVDLFLEHETANDCEEEHDRTAAAHQEIWRQARRRQHRRHDPVFRPTEGSNPSYCAYPVIFAVRLAPLLDPLHRNRRRSWVRRLRRANRFRRRTVPAATRTTRPRGSCAGRRRRSSRGGSVAGACLP